MSTIHHENEHYTATGSNTEQKTPHTEELKQYDSIYMKFKH